MLDSQACSGVESSLTKLIDKKNYSIEDYEKRFLDSLTKLNVNTPQWMPPPPTAQSSLLHSNGDSQHTKLRYDKLKQRFKAKRNNENDNKIQFKSKLVFIQRN